MRGVRNGALAGALVVIVLGMTGLSFAAVPLYRMFCEATGYGGTLKIATLVAPGGTGDTIEIRFDANTSGTLAWQFTADQSTVRVRLGEEQLAGYTGINRGQASTGVAAYNVSPEKAAPYFHKTACFCFDEQRLNAGQSANFPLSYWIDPAIRSNPDTKDVRSITLSYTFFRSLDDAARAGQLENAGPHVGKRTSAVSTLNGSAISR